MGTQKKIGVQIDSDLWNEFRDDVRHRTGRTRGQLGEELEKAIENYLYSADGDDAIDIAREMNERQKRMERMLEEGLVAEADGMGGTPSENQSPKRLNAKRSVEGNINSSSDASPSTDSPETVDAPPDTPRVRMTDEELFTAGNPFGKKVDRVEERIRELYPEEKAAKKSLKMSIKDITDFSDQTVTKYLDEIIDRMGISDNPGSGAPLVWGTRLKYERKAEGRKPLSEMPDMEKLSEATDGALEVISDADAAE